VLGNWVGGFEIKTQCGSNKLILRYKYGKYTVTLSELKNGVLNYELFKAACELVQKAPETIESKLQTGRFLFTGASIEPIIDPHGKDIIIEDIEDIYIDVGKVKVEDSKEGVFLCLYDIEGYQIMRTPAGLIATDYIPFHDEFKDFKIEGVSLYKLSLHRIFSMNFEFNQLTPKQMIDILDDLEVKKPKISQSTKDRLIRIIADDWEIKGEEDFFRERDDEFESEQIMDDLIETEPDITGLELGDTKTEDIYDELMDPNFSWDLITTLPTVKMKYQPQRILDRVIHAKYNLIALSSIDPASLSENLIRLVYRATHSKNLVYSLVYLYDKIYTNKEIRSPMTVSLSWRTDFQEKFNLDNGESLNIS
jgi:hypothetical protein